jgi:hypothetical protein
VRKGLVVAGSVLFGSVYLTTLLAAPLGNVGEASCAGGVCSAVSRPAKLLILPVAGPFTLLGATDETGAVFLVLDGVLQAGGVAMLAAGLAVPKTMLVQSDAHNVTWMPAPMTFGARSAGLGVIGAF